MNYVFILTSVVVLAHFADKWFLSKGQLLYVYSIGIIGSLLTILLNIHLVEAHEDQIGLLLFVFNSSWTIMMCVKGLYRISKEKKEKLIHENSYLWNPKRG